MFPLTQYTGPSAEHVEQVNRCNLELDSLKDIPVLGSRMVAGEQRRDVVVSKGVAESEFDDKGV